MTTKLLSITCATAALCLAAAQPALAGGGDRDKQKGKHEAKVTVNIGTVADDIALAINADAAELPETVEAPIGIAAQVCGIGANELAQQRRDGEAECTALNTTDAFNELVERRT